MKYFLGLALLIGLSAAGTISAQEKGIFRGSNLEFSKYNKVPKKVPSYLAPHSKFELFPIPKRNRVPKVVVTKTVELSRVAFQKWEEHDYGIKMLGNYMKVTYQTFYSDGTSRVWDKEFRS